MSSERKCVSCGDPDVNGYGVAAHVRKRSNMMYFCKKQECRSVVATLCKCVNIMNRRIDGGVLYPAKKKKGGGYTKSELDTIFEMYLSAWTPKLEDKEAFPEPAQFRRKIEQATL